MKKTFCKKTYKKKARILRLIKLTPRAIWTKLWKGISFKANIPLQVGKDCETPEPAWLFMFCTKVVL